MSNSSLGSYFYLLFEQNLGDITLQLLRCCETLKSIFITIWCCFLIIIVTKVFIFNGMKQLLFTSSLPLKRNT